MLLYNVFLVFTYKYEHCKSLLSSTKHIRYNKIIETEFFIIYISMYNILIYN